MEQRRLGNTEMTVGILGFGGSEIGLENADFETVDKLLHNALDNGLNVIDTAECYNNSEELIGRAVSNRRSEFYLFTKCGHSDDLHFEDWDIELIERNVDRSLKRLKTDYIDLLQLHGCSADVLKQGDVIHILRNIQSKGKVRYIGYSGDGEDAMYAVQTECFDTLQTSINIADQLAVEEVIPAAKQLGIGVIAKRPLANVAWIHGDLNLKRYQRQLEMMKRLKSSDEHSLNKPAKVTYWERLLALDYPFIADDFAALENAIRFTISIPGVHTAIVGTKNPERWLENLELVRKGPISLEQYEKIREKWKIASKEDWQAVR